MLAVMSVIMAGVARADSFWSIVLTTIAVMTALQLSYLAGEAIDMAITSIFPPRKGERDSGQNLAIQQVWLLTAGRCQNLL
jgi:hypothetical protein